MLCLDQCRPPKWVDVNVGNIVRMLTKFILVFKQKNCDLFSTMTSPCICITCISLMRLRSMIDPLWPGITGNVVYVTDEAIVGQ